MFDTAKFATCVATTTSSDAVEAGLAAGKSINLRGTPMVLINGWHYPIPPYDSLTAVVRQRLREVK